MLRGHEGPVVSAAFSPDGTRVVTASGDMLTASEDRTARVWNIDGTGEPVVLRGHEGSVRSAVFSPDGSQIVFGSNRNNGGTNDTNVFIADWIENPGM